jgi:hypothetical protein
VPPRPRPTPDELGEAILVELDAALDQLGTEAYERATRAADAAVNKLLGGLHFTGARCVERGWHERGDAEGARCSSDPAGDACRRSRRTRCVPFG